MQSLLCQDHSSKNKVYFGVFHLVFGQSEKYLFLNILKNYFFNLLQAYFLKKYFIIINVV